MTAEARQPNNLGLLEKIEMRDTNKKSPFLGGLFESVLCSDIKGKL
jgi:hypothetical protein